MRDRRLVIGNTPSGADSSRLEERHAGMLCVQMRLFEICLYIYIRLFMPPSLDIWSRNKLYKIGCQS